MTDPQHDVVIVGGRVAGSSTAMLLAQKGYKVLVVDRASFPSDTLSTHQVQLPGVARLKRWGLLDRVIASNAPATPNLRFDWGQVVLEGHFPTYQSVDSLYSPRRTVLDKILVDAAREAGAEVRENFVVDGLIKENGMVRGIKGREDGRETLVETARLVVGADGKRSIVAESVGASAYHAKPPLAMAFYAYWEGLPVQGGELYRRGSRAIGVWPTNDGLVMTYIAGPVRDFDAFRSDLEGNFLKTLDLADDLGRRARVGRRIGPIKGTSDLPNFFRKPFGPGWALVGDAGLVMDPVTGQGISDAFRDAELLAGAIDLGFSGKQSLDVAFASYEHRRNLEAMPMYDFTTELASFGAARPEEKILMESLSKSQDNIERFFGVLTGAVPIAEYFAPRNLVKIIGVRGMAKVIIGKMRSHRPSMADEKNS